MKYCSHCGKEVHEDALVCMGCGCAVPKNPSTAGGCGCGCSDSGSEVAPDGTPYSDKKGIVALILAFFFGSFGVHRFYVGRIGSAIGMLLLFIAGYGTLIGSIVATTMHRHGDFYCNDGWIQGQETMTDCTDTSLVFFVGIGIGTLLFLGWFIWWLIDVIKICSSQFKDKEGHIVKFN